MVDKNTPVEPIWTSTGEGSPDDALAIDPPEWVDHIEWVVVGTRKADTK